MRQALQVIASEAGIVAPHDWSKLGYVETQGVRARLAARYSPATANRMLAALRGTLREAVRLGQMSGEDFRRATDLRSVRGARVLRGRALDRQEVAALFGQCAGRGAAGTRDAALVGILFAGGLRRAEVVALDVAALDLQARTLLVRGKGNKERLVHLPSGVLSLVDQWLAVRGESAGPLLLPINKAGRLVGRRLTPHAVLLIVRKLADRAGLGRLSPHDLRRTCASLHLDAGTALSTVSAILGHASVTTTARYDLRGERAKRRAAERVDVPSIATAA